MAEKIRVMKVDQDEGESSLYLAIDKNGFEFLEAEIEAAPEVGDKYILRVVEVDKDWFNNLPEWDGFY